ncbi:Uncharacterized protein TCM_015958 [Theobroma cacao]|uniref:Uncharacterized protein n=1 Tax=Theobroma cacao TaxID=3641 RepID=A0A061G4K3_THECC|nr:Uncharacterized protein TCM_015958 [Theobroma cacao]
MNGINLSLEEYNQRSYVFLGRQGHMVASLRDRLGLLRVIDMERLLISRQSHPTGGCVTPYMWQPTFKFQTSNILPHFYQCSIHVYFTCSSVLCIP